MSWGLTFLIALVTSIASAGAAGFVASLCVDWFRISSREGGSGYFVIFIGLLGLIAGFIIGAVTGRLVTSGFWIAQGYSLAIVVGLCLSAAVVARSMGEVAPTIGGDRLLLEIELKCPRNWQPDNKTRSLGGRQCLLDVLGPVMHGSIDWNQARQVDGQWVVPCAVNLFSSRRNRYPRIILGKNVDVSFLLPLPGEPGREQFEWSQWSNQNFSHETGKPPVTDYQFRCRVRTLSSVEKELDDAARTASQARINAVAAVPPKASLEAWLPFFEQADTGLPSSDQPYGVEQRAVDEVKGRPLELLPALQSKDLPTVRRAVYAATALDEVSPELAEPLANAGRVTISLIQAARAKALPGDPDLVGEALALSYFFKWGLALGKAGPAGAPGHLAVLKQIVAEVGTAADGDLSTLRSYAERDIEAAKTKTAP